MLAGELERQPRINRAEHRRPSRDALREAVNVGQQPFDLRRREVRVEHEAGALAYQRLDPFAAQLVAALRRAAVLPDERAVERLAGSRVPNADRLALVADPDCRQTAGLNACRLQRLKRHGAGNAPDLSRIMLNPAGLGKVLLKLAVGAAEQLHLGVEDEASGSGSSLIYREDHWANLPPQPPREPNGDEVEQLTEAVREAAPAAAGSAVLKVNFDFDHAEAGARGVNGHSDLHPEARREWQHLRQRVGADRPLARDRRSELKADEIVDRPARKTNSETEASADLAREAGDGHIPLATLYSFKQNTERGGAAGEIAVTEQHQLRLRQQRSPRAQASRATLADQLAAADDLRPGLHSARGGVVA